MENNLETLQLPDGLGNLVKGYVAYAEEVITNRALPDGRDGLKPVNRRILYYLNTIKKKGMVKSANVAGGVMSAYHPHGDGSIYEALVRMSDKNGTLNIPTVAGQGSFGRVYNNDKAASMRYTHCGYHPNADDYLSDLDGVQFVPNFDATTTEPSLLPVKYPALLCNSVSGIAVGFSCNIPAFNLKDVCELAKEYIRDGECKTVICPDFSTGGYYIKNNKELMKLMRTGKASLKIRGRVEVIDKEINIREVPFGNTLQSIAKDIKSKNIQGIKNVSDYDDFEHGACLCVECTSKGRVDEVLLALYKETGLQDTFSADITSIIDGEPQRHGVWEYIKIWVEWRKEVLKKQFKSDIESLENTLKYPKSIIKVVDDSEFRDKLVDVILHKSDAEAVKLIMDKFDDIDHETATWIVGRRMSQLRDGGKYRNQYQTILDNLKTYNNYLDDLGSYIIKELDEVIVQRSSLCNRKTEITTTDYEFVEKEESVEIAKDMTECYYTFEKGFLKKMRFAVEGEGRSVIQALASDTLIAVDNRGRVLRVYCEHIPYCGKSEVGIYLPKYFGVDSDDKDYEIKWIGALDGSKKMLVYSDGNVGFLDTSEWLGLTRQVKIVERGIYADGSNLAYVCDVPEYLFVIDNQGKIAWEAVANIKQKSRTARTKVFNLTKGNKITAVAVKNGVEGLGVLQNMSRYNTGKLVHLESQEDYIAPDNTFISIS